MICAKTESSSPWQPGLDHKVDNAFPWKCLAVYFLSFIPCTVFLFHYKKGSKGSETNTEQEKKHERG